MTDSRSSYEKKMHEQLNQIGSSISNLLDTLETTARTECAKQREILEPRLKAVKDNLQDLTTATGEAWQDVKPGMERAWAELKKAFDQAASRFK